MEFRILGHPEVTAGGQRVPVGGPTEQKLLAVLLPDANHVVPLTRLVEALWRKPRRHGRLLSTWRRGRAAGHPLLRLVSW